MTLTAIQKKFSLTPRQTQVACRVLRGFTRKEIARNLEISPFTVDEHLAALRLKTGADSNFKLAVKLVVLRGVPTPKIQ